jgi:hypothetical protein
MRACRPREPGFQRQARVILPNRDSGTEEAKLDIRKQVVTEIARLNKILALLDDSDDVRVQTPTRVDGRTKAGRVGKPRRKGKMSAAARRKISRLQKERWAKWRASQK